MATRDRMVVFDIDGTLADITHRRHHVQNGRRNWPAFNREMVNDTPHDDILWLAEMLYKAGCLIVIASGRGEEDREKTVNWLASHGAYDMRIPTSPENTRFFYAQLYMRPAKDSRKDSIIKREILDQIEVDWKMKPYMVFDDRNQVVDMWRENGIRCLQVAPGDF